jgi:hypothetical protein
METSSSAEGSQKLIRIVIIVVENQTAPEREAA